MAHIPGLMPGYSPGIYGLTHYIIKKIGEDNYSIAYYNVEFSGSCREIAKQIILKISKNQKYGMLGTDAAFVIDFKSENICTFGHNVKAPEGESLKEIATKISIELKKLKPLIVFI